MSILLGKWNERKEYEGGHSKANCYVINRNYGL